MRGLVISHNVFCRTTNMGKTLSAYFRGWNQEDIAQFYIHTEVPTDDICANYYRITDKEAIRSIFTRKSGIIFSNGELETKNIEAVPVGMTATLYQKARKKTPITYLARNLWWTLGAWKTKKLMRWLDEFNPEAIFFASGDYAFMYVIARRISEIRNIPLYVCCMDDYYLYNKNKDYFLGKFVHSIFMRQVYKTMHEAKVIFCICDSMSVEYEKKFKKKCITLHTPASFQSKLSGEKKRKIAYMGNLGFNRHLQLVEIGRALQGLHMDIDHIDVYSAETRTEILECMTEENGISFHGSVCAEEVKKIMAESLAVIHTEAFDENIRHAVKYSVSTKIADSLMSGTCIFAYGPAEVASIQYLMDNEAAICACSREELSQRLKTLLENQQLREKHERIAFDLANKNHRPEKNQGLIKTVLGEELI